MSEEGDYSHISSAGVIEIDDREREVKRKICEEIAAEIF